MVGTMAFRYLLPHLLYECVAFAGAIRDGRAMTFIHAKASFLGNLVWVIRERRKLRLSLMASGDLRLAKRRLHTGMAPWWKALSIRWAERRG